MLAFQELENQGEQSDDKGMPGSYCAVPSICVAESIGYEDDHGSATKKLWVEDAERAMHLYFGPVTSAVGRGCLDLVCMKENT